MPPSTASTQQLASAVRAGKRASGETDNDNARRRRGQHDPDSTAYSAIDRIPVRSSPVQRHNNDLDCEMMNSPPITKTPFPIQESANTSRTSFVTVGLSSQSSDATDATDYTDLHDRNDSPNISLMPSVEVTRSSRGSMLTTANETNGLPALICSNAATHGSKNDVHRSKDNVRSMQKIWRECFDILVLENSHTHQ
jgi:hypothetical protein